MVSFFRPREERSTLRIIGDGDTEVALIKGLKQVIWETGALPRDLEVTIKSLKKGGGNPSKALDVSLQKHFLSAAYHRRILVVDSEGAAVDSGLYVRANGVGVEMKLSEPCIERHMLFAYGIPCSSDLKSQQYKKVLSDHFGTDFHPCDSDWHAKQIKQYGLADMISRDELISFIHGALTSTDHPTYK